MRDRTRSCLRLRVRGQALAIFFGITSFTLFLSVTIYAGEVNKASAFNQDTNPNGKLPGGKWGPGFGLTIFGKVTQCPRVALL